MNDKEFDTDTIEQTGDSSAFPADVINAIIEAHRAVLGGLDLDVFFRSPTSGDHSRVVGHFAVNYPEKPIVGDDGELLGWAAPYRTREDVDEKLRDLMPDGYMYEWENSVETTVYID